MSQFSDHWSEEAWRAGNDPAYQNRFSTYGVVTKHPHDDESVVHAKVDGESYYWRAVKAFSTFVGNRDRHGKKITEVYWQGNQVCYYAAQVEYIAGRLKDEEIPEEYKEAFTKLARL